MRAGGRDGPSALSPELLQDAAGRFGLLASPMRLHIVWLLAQQDMDVGALAEAVGGSLPAVSQQLAKLKLAGLVRSQRDGRRQVYVVDDPALVAMVRLAFEHLGGAPPSRERRDGLGA